MDAIARQFLHNWGLGGLSHGYVCNEADLNTLGRKKAEGVDQIGMRYIELSQVNAIGGGAQLSENKIERYPPRGKGCCDLICQYGLSAQ